MARPQKAINPIRAQRLKEIMTNENVSQRELSKRLNLSQQSISRIINGAASLTETTAELLIHEFPKYRFEWVMGYDNIKTHEDMVDYQLGLVAERDTVLETARDIQLKALGYSFAETSYVLHGNDESHGPINVFKYNNKIGVISYNDYTSLMDNFDIYIETKLLSAIRKNTL
ncbi:MAG: helix-turn-helix transcriptional regulator [Clostridia bacterium]|nr:helix-turn-helix transcriptional regulator [Clostridia bacterium]